MTKPKPKEPQTNLLAQKAVLAAVNARCWGALRVDKKITEEVHQKHNASKDAGRYNKLLVEKDDLAGLNAIRASARIKHYSMTQPWMDDGSRILPSALYMDYAEVMRKFKTDFDNEANKFAADYPDMIEKAKQRLNVMFNLDDYPDPSQIRSAFSFDIKIMPCPEAKDFRVDIAAEHLTEIQHDVEARLKGALESAMLDTRDRIVKVVGHMAERLKAYNPSVAEGERVQGMFRDSLVENVRELVTLLPAFNLTDNKKLVAITARIQKELCKEDAEALREDPTLRASVAKAADKILTDVASFMA